MFRQVLDDIRRATAAGVKIVRVNIDGGGGGASVEVGR